MERRTMIFEEVTQCNQLYDVRMTVEVVETPIDGRFSPITTKCFHIKLTGRMFTGEGSALNAVLPAGRVVKLMEALNQHLTKQEKA